MLLSLSVVMHVKLAIRESIHRLSIGARSIKLASTLPAQPRSMCACNCTVGSVRDSRPRIARAGFACSGTDRARPGAHPVSTPGTCLFLFLFT